MTCHQAKEVQAEIERLTRIVSSRDDMDVQHGEAIDQLRDEIARLLALGGKP